MRLACVLSKTLHGRQGGVADQVKEPGGWTPGGRREEAPMSLLESIGKPGGRGEHGMFKKDKLLSEVGRMKHIQRTLSWRIKGRRAGK